MKRLCYTILWMLVVCFWHTARADDPPTQQKKAIETPSSFSSLAPVPAEKHDSLIRLQEERSDRLYDSIQAKTSRSKFARLLYKSLFRSPKGSSIEREYIRDENALMRPYQDRRIGDIFIVRNNPFDEDGNWLERAANNTHMLTRERVIRRDLLFQTGDKLDPQIIARNKQLLQSRPYISDVEISVEPNPDDPNVVDVLVRTRDSWTIDGDIRIRGGGETSLGISEANLLGRGHELRIETNFDYRTFDYGGNVIEYDIPNLLGSFYTYSFDVGRRFEASFFRMAIDKKFLRPIDYELGASCGYVKDEFRFIDRDTSELVSRRDINLWVGYTRPIESLNSNIYLATRYNFLRFPRRPDETTSINNTALHGYDAILVALGLYREHFYSANMIYRYGTREYLSSGYKSELTVGRVWGEFYDQYYMGVDQMLGGFVPFGFLKGGFKLGGFYNTQRNRWQQITLNGRIGWFSNLFRVARSHTRQFISLSYTQGWRRFFGAGECIEFTDENEIRALDKSPIGTTRLVLTSETDFFTPMAPLGFKTVLYGFIDGGFLGSHDNVFRNGFYTSFGIGVRFRNERLVFHTIAIRLGVAFGPGGLAPSEYFNLSTESPVGHYRFTPERPEFVTFK